MVLVHFDFFFFPLPDLNRSGLYYNFPGYLFLFSFYVFFQNLCVLFFCSLGELFKYVVYITDFIFCMLILSFPGSKGNSISLLAFSLWCPYILFSVNESFISVFFSACWFHVITYLFFLSLSFKNRGHIWCSL